ncbi:MAG: hypothetical protein J0I47_03745 [Sphingomonas sp.]|uniref:hypothetical protein n=1 Tax=Sphingomonas sp. TaxID=28214 RepID=UPI001AC3A503|nr:hypothetical protein [Sphingomonas sp.]MBN8807338.1 hypothetical protein [Sphingomonas sp.]
MTSDEVSPAKPGTAPPAAPFAISLIALLGASLTALAYWPGFMTWDAIRQYGQALTGEFDDWHPPAMGWLWRQLTAIHAGPAPMLVVQLTLEWVGLALLAGWAWARGRGGLAALILACGFLPFPLALTGEVLKDCLMAGALLAAAGALAQVEGSRHATVWRIAGLALLVFAATLRFNAFLATVPLAVALLPRAWWRGRGRLLVATAVSAAVMVAALPVANRLIGAKPSGVGLSLVIFDLGGITHFSGQFAFPPITDFDASDDPAGIVSACYDPSKWDRYAWWGAAPCDIGFDNVDDAFTAQHISPYRWWAGEIAAHPFAYAEHRLTHFDINARLFSRDLAERPVQIDPPPNDWGYRVTPGPLLGAIDAAAVWSAATPLGWPILWMAVALGVLIAGSASPSARVFVPLALSSLLYGLGYGVFSVASELRYHLWTILAAMIAALIVASNLLDGARVPRPRLIAAAVPPLLILVACVAWRALDPA